jgi:NitT/TauT family transport system substrate-binding protein
MTHPFSSITRRDFAAGAASLVAAPALVRAQGSMTKIKITQPSESLSYMPIYVGRAMGFFKDAGIDLEVVVTRGDGPDVQALMAKEVEFVATPPHHLWTLYTQGRKLQAIAGIFGRCGISLVMGADTAKERGVTENSPIADKLKALKGLTISVSAPGSLTYNIAQYYIIRAGMKPQQDVMVVPTGLAPSTMAAMKNKIATAAAQSSPLTDQMVKDGTCVWMINNTLAQDPELKDFLHAVIHVRPEYAAENTDLTKRMVAAIVKSAAWIKATSPDEIGKTIKPYFKSLDDDIYMNALTAIREAVIPDGKMSRTGAETYQKVLLMTGHLKEPVAYDAVFTDKFLPA